MASFDMTASPRARTIAWCFLLGVILLEGWGIAASFHTASVIAPYLTRHWAPPAAWLLAVVISVVFVWVSAWRTGFIGHLVLLPSHWAPYAALRTAAIPMAMISGFFEEALFRQTLMNAAMAHGVGPAAQVALSALAFGAVHAVWGIASANWRGALNAMAATSALGAALACLYLAGGRAIAPCIAAHVAINLLLEPWLILAAATGQWRSATDR